MNEKEFQVLLAESAELHERQSALVATQSAQAQSQRQFTWFLIAMSAVAFAVLFAMFLLLKQSTELHYTEFKRFQDLRETQRLDFQAKYKADVEAQDGVNERQNEFNDLVVKRLKEK